MKFKLPTFTGSSKAPPSAAEPAPAPAAPTISPAPAAPAAPIRPLPFGHTEASPLVVESDTDTAWDAWHNAHADHPPQFADTVPATVPQALGDLPADSSPMRSAPAQKPVTLDDVLNETALNQRVCPNQARWQQLYELLLGRTATTHSAPPPPPLDLRAYAAMPGLHKTMAFRHLVQWAGEHGRLDQTLGFLKGLREDEWLHLDD